MMDKKEVLCNYEKRLRKDEMAENTVKSYLATATYYLKTYNSIDRYSILQYKEFLISTYKPATVNLRLLALNNFLHYMKKDNLKVKTIKIQQRSFLDNVISNTDYRKLVRCLSEDGKTKWYMIVRTLACTGARISEVLTFQVEDVYQGYVELYAKGNKIRRIYFPKVLRSELCQWLEDENRTGGSLFLNKNGVTISANGISRMLRKFSEKYRIDPKVMHPHSFRHRFALNFMARKPNEILLLADLLGHSNINTTRIYTRRTSQEQYRIINTVVNW